MPECKYGCGNEGTHRTKIGEFLCVAPPYRCLTIKAKMGVAQRKAYQEGRREVPESRRHSLAVTTNKLRTEGKWQPWNKGKKGVQVPWNKGHRKRTDVAAPKDDVFASFRRYRNRVTTRTERTYLQYKEEINPHNHPRGKCGVPGAWQLDHKVSVREGFERRIPVDQIAAKENLQMLPWLENIRKYDK